MKGFENGDPSVMESILMDSLESVFMIKLYLKFCENVGKKPCLKYDVISSFLGKRSLDRYIDIERLKKHYKGRSLMFSHRWLNT